MAAFDPFYTTGTVSVANGGTTVTGVGTGFNTAGIRAGDLFISSTFTSWAVVTAEPSSATSLAITAWPGTTLSSGSSYRIWRISDADRVIAASAAFMQNLTPNLAALGGLTLAANKGIYATGAGALGTFDMTAYARTLLDDASQAAMQSTLGVAPKQANLLDATPGAGLIVGAFGLGAAQTAITQANLDDLSLPTGFYRVVSPTGLPAGTYSIINNNPTGASCSQRLERINVAYGIYSRISSAVLTTPWAAEHIVTGTNANGDFLLSGNGWLVCRKQSFGLSYANASVLNNTWNYPMNFASAPSVSASLTSAPPGGHREGIFYGSSVNAGNAVVATIDNAGTYTAGTTATVSVRAEGWAA